MPSLRLHCKTVRGALCPMPKSVILTISVALILFFISTKIHISRQSVDLVDQDKTRETEYKQVVPNTEESRIDEQTLNGDVVGGLDVVDGPKWYLLNSYMRSGSSFTGELLGHRDNTFYMYEPVGRLGWSYWRGSDNICSLRRRECKTAVKSDVSYIYDLLTQCYSCNQHLLSIMNQMRVNNGGPAFNHLRACRANSSKTTEDCNIIIMNMCTNAQSRVSKVLRLAVDTLEPLLQRHQNLKIVHLFRDPRAIINSRMKTVWFPSLKNETLLNWEAESLCDKMLYDYNAGVVLAKKYPNRFRMILYEDLMSDLHSKTKSLFTFLNLPFTDADEARISIITANTSDAIKPHLAKGDKSRIAHMDQSKDYAFWWRTYIQWRTVQIVDRHCSEVEDKLGYSRFKLEDEFRNMEYPSMSARETMTEL